MSKSVILFILALPFLFACSDSMENPMDPELIIEAPGEESEIIRILSSNDDRAWVNSTFSLEMFGEIECRKDDVFTFFADGSFEYDGGSQLCGDSDNKQIVQGTWELDFDNGVIIFNKGAEDETSARYITIKEEIIRLQGAWNGFAIDAQYIPR